MRLLQLLEWIALVLTFGLGFVLGSWLQHRQDRRYLKELEQVIRYDSMERTVRNLAAQEELRRPSLNLVKGFDRDD